MQAIYTSLPNGLAISIVNKGRVITWQEVIDGWLNSDDFRRLFDGLFQLLPGAVWHTIPLAGLGVPFVMALLNIDKIPVVDATPILNTVVDPYVNVVTSSDNTGLLVIPAPIQPYGTLYDLTTKGPIAQRDAFYQTLARTAQEYLTSKILAWLTSEVDLSWLAVKFNENLRQIMPVTNSKLSYDISAWSNLIPKQLKIDDMANKELVEKIASLNYPRAQTGRPLFPEEETEDPEILSRYRVYITTKEVPDLSSLLQQQLIPRVFILNTYPSSSMLSYPILQFLPISLAELYRQANIRRVLSGDLYPIYLSEELRTPGGLETELEDVQAQRSTF